MLLLCVGDPTSAMHLSQCGTHPRQPLLPASQASRPLQPVPASLLPAPHSLSTAAAGASWVTDQAAGYDCALSCTCCHTVSAWSHLLPT